MRLAGREEIVGMARGAAARSDAFLTEGEARLLVATQPTSVVGATERTRSAVFVLAQLSEVLVERGMVSGWYLACGTTPDELTTLSALGARRAELEARVLQGDAAQAAQVLCSLNRPDTGPSLPLAIRCTPDELNALLQALHRLAGPDQPLWWCDDSLQARFSMRRSGATFRCAHPLMQTALERRCRKDHIDLA